MIQRTSKCISRPRRGGGGCHKDSFVSVLAVALAAAKKIEAKGWMDDDMKAWHDVEEISLFVTVV